LGEAARQGQEALDEDLAGDRLAFLGEPLKEHAILSQPLLVDRSPAVNALPCRAGR
jgi:hypothetical protein